MDMHLDFAGLPIASLDTIIGFFAIWTLLTLALYALVRLSKGDEIGEKQRRPPPVRIRPIDASGWTVLVDGSNVARDGDTADLERLRSFVKKLEKGLAGSHVIVFCDANLRYKFPPEQREIFKALLVSRQFGTYRECPSGCTADEVLLKHASKTWPCIVVSNDRFDKVEEERSLRQGLPLLRFKVQERAVVPYRNVRIYKKSDIGHQPTEMALRDLIAKVNESRRRAAA